MNLKVSYYKCQSCTSRVNCRSCGAELAERLLTVPGIHGAEFRLEAGLLALDTALDPDTVEDVLESCSVFLV